MRPISPPPPAPTDRDPGTKIREGDQSVLVVALTVMGAVLVVTYWVVT